jgi:hypothetical protein
MRGVKSTAALGVALAMAAFVPPVAATVEPYLIVENAAHRIERVVLRTSASMTECADHCMVALHEADDRGVPYYDLCCMAMDYERTVFANAMFAGHTIRVLHENTLAVLRRTGIRASILTKFNGWVASAENTVYLRMEAEITRIDALLVSMGP